VYIAAVATTPHTSASAASARRVARVDATLGSHSTASAAALP
jgi:hypothetical protein